MGDLEIRSGWIARTETRQDVGEPASIGLALEKERLERLHHQLQAEARRLEKLRRGELRIIDHGDSGPEADGTDDDPPRLEREPILIEHDDI